MGKEIKLTEEEIVKALGLCAKDVTCILDYDCPLREDKNCHTTLSKLALDMINRQKAEIKRLTEERNKYIVELDEVESANDYANKFLGEYKAKNEELQKQVDELTKENERLADLEFTQEHCDLYKENEYLKECLVLSKAQAVKAAVPLAIQRFINQLDIDGIVKYGSDLYEKLKETKKFVLKRYYGVEVE